MLVFGTQMHIVTFAFVVLEFSMFIFQTAVFLFRPQDKLRAYYLILLFLLLLYNITGGLFPDSSLKIPIFVQMAAAYGTCFLMSSYLPTFFYKVIDLPSLRWHVFYGVPLFLILPYLIFFVIIYAIDGDFNQALKYGMIIPFLYALVLLYVMFRGIRKKYYNSRDKKHFYKETITYFAISPWAALTFFGVVESSQLLEVLCTNSGIVFVTLIFFAQSVKNARKEHLKELRNFQNVGLRNFEIRSAQYKLTKREIEIIELFCQGLTYHEISEKLYISTKTVGNHIHNVYEKTKAKNRVDLICKLSG